jgi:LysR family transcriptional regulator, regulatory protein for tcuABC
MDCVYDGMGATIKPMAAVFHEGVRGRKWRALSITGARMRRPNFLYSLAPARLSTAAALVAAELRSTTQFLIASGAWSGVAAIAPLPVGREATSASAAVAG